MLDNHQKQQGCNKPLPTIPEKRYFTIGEVSELCQVKPHVLRYWEQEFSSLQPNKRRGNRRYYQYKDVLMVRQIRALLYEQGYTIQGARQFLAQSPIKTTTPNHFNQLTTEIIQALEETIQQLK